MNAILIIAVGATINHGTRAKKMRRNMYLKCAGLYIIKV